MQHQLFSFPFRISFNDLVINQTNMEKQCYQFSSDNTQKFTYFQDFREVQGMDKKGKEKKKRGTVYREKPHHWFVVTDLIAS